MSQNFSHDFLEYYNFCFILLVYFLYRIRLLVIDEYE